MDVSKLPKLSQSEPPPNNNPGTASDADSPRRAEPIDYRSVPPEPISGGEIWFSVIVGVIFILLGRSFAAYELSRMTGKAYHTGVNWTAGPNAGQEVAYPDLQGFVFWNDSAMFLIGVAVVLDALLRVVISSGGAAGRPLAYLGFGITILATLYNLYVASLLMKGNVLPLLSLLAVAMGGYIAFSQWQLIKAQNRLAQARR